MLTLRINLLFTWNSNLTGRPLFLLFICFFLWIWQHQITGTSELSCAWHRDFWGPCVVWNASEGGQVWVYTTRDRGRLGIKWWLNRWLRTWPLPPVTVWNLGTQSPVWYGRGRSFQSFWCWISSIELVMLSNHFILCLFSFCLQSFPASESFPMINCYNSPSADWEPALMVSCAGHWGHSSERDTAPAARTPPPPPLRRQICPRDLCPQTQHNLCWGWPLRWLNFGPPQAITLRRWFSAEPGLHLKVSDQEI